MIKKLLVPPWKVDSGHATEGYIVIFNVGHSLLGQYVHVVVNIIDKIKNINSLDIIASLLA